MKNEVIFSDEQIAKKTEELARALTQELTDRELVMVGVLKSGVLFYADLIRQINRPLICDFIETEEQQDSGSRMVMSLDLTQNLTDKQVVLVDSHFEKGARLDYLLERILQENPSKLYTCCLWASSQATCDFQGFAHPKAAWIRGYGKGSEFENPFHRHLYLNTEGVLR